jgi:hypothetical protein
MVRRRERRRRRRKVGLAGLAVLVALGLGLGLDFGLGGGGEAAPPHRTAAHTKQHTLLLSVAGGHGVSTGAALFGTAGAHEKGVEVLVPGWLIVGVPGYGQQLLGDAAGLPNGARLAKEGIADLLGIRIDAGWSLNTNALATLVDRVGGITVTVDTDIPQSQSGGGHRVVVPAGRHHLDGRRAVAFASYRPSGSEARAALPRFQEVLDAVLRALPRKQADVAALVGHLGNGAHATVPADRLAHQLVAVRSELTGNRLYSTVQPVQAISTGRTPLYRVKTDAADRLVRSRLTTADRARSGLTTVYVENNVGTPHLGDAVRHDLVAAGFGFAGSANLAPFGTHKHSVVLIFSRDAKARKIGARVAKALGLPPAAVRYSNQRQHVGDVIVIVGADYQP